MSEDEPTGVEAPQQRQDTPYYTNAPGGRGLLKGVGHILADQRRTTDASRTPMRQKKSGGHMFNSCAWTRPAQPHSFEFCETLAYRGLPLRIRPDDSAAQARAAE